jgi:hypothetical protein
MTLLALSLGLACRTKTSDTDDTHTDTDTDTHTDTDTDTDPEEQLWFYVATNLQVEQNVDDTKALIERAAEAGYTGMVLSDFKLHMLNDEALADWYPENLSNVLEHAAAQGLQVMPSTLPFGYSEGILRSDPNLAEGQKVTDAPFTVSGNGMHLHHSPTWGGIQGGDFESHNGTDFSGWSWHDEPGVRTVVDTSVAHSGTTSARIDAGQGNARFMQTLDLPQHRQFHLRFYLKTEGFSTPWFNAMLYDVDDNRMLSYASFSVAKDQDWTQYDLVANSRDFTSTALYIGAWDSSEGSLWIDDVSVEETALVNLVRRDGAPVVLRNGSGGLLPEGSEVDTVSDPLSGSNGIFDDWHEAPTVTLPSSSSLSPGDTVTIDYYAVAPIYGYGVGACLTAEGTHDWMGEALSSINSTFPASPGFLLAYDEMRHANSCAGCQATGKTPGELLAWHIGMANEMVLSQKPDADIYVWSDMFDPTHNAVDNYYLAEGDFSGSWEGLQEENVVMNWQHGERAASFAHFSSLGIRQVVAGYYDSGDGANSAAADLAAAEGVDGVVGYMYTTWQDDYSQLEAYAEAILASW